jgi:hypothetical protein
MNMMPCVTNHDSRFAVSERPCIFICKKHRRRTGVNHQKPHAAEGSRFDRSTPPTHRLLDVRLLLLDKAANQLRDGPEEREDHQEAEEASEVRCAQIEANRTAIELSSSLGAAQRSQGTRLSNGRCKASSSETTNGRDTKARNSHPNRSSRCTGVGKGPTCRFSELKPVALTAAHAATQANPDQTEQNTPISSVR